MRPERKQWVSFKGRFWDGRENQCEVCGSLKNYRAGQPVDGLRMDMAHLVAKSELYQFGDVGRSFNTYEDNMVLLCQKCHAALDLWLGVMGPTNRRRATPRFELYRDRFLMLLRRRDKLLRTLISLSAEPPPQSEDVRRVDSSCGSPYSNPVRSGGSHYPHTGAVGESITHPPTASPDKNTLLIRGSGGRAPSNRDY